MRALWIALVLAGCSSVELDPVRVKIGTGPALSRPIRKVVAVRATCGSLSSFSNEGLKRRQGDQPLKGYVSDAVDCTETQIDGVDQLVRSELEFRGYSVVDSERVNAVTAARTEVIVRDTTAHADGRLTASEKSEATTRGSLFADAPPALQDQILAELGAEGLLNARIFVGAPTARSPSRNVFVQVRLVDVTSGDLVWASRCRLNAGWDLDEVAIMKAARCAVAKIVTRPR